MTPLDLLQAGEIVAFLLLGVAIIEAIALHEFGHAAVADLQGDRLPRAMGRLTLNPKAHLDPLGTILIFLVGFGWGKPVEFRPQAFSSRRFGSAVVALAGPGMNVLLAIAAAFALRFALEVRAPIDVLAFLDVFSQINIILAIFNLLPIPPLDGSRLLTIFLPPHRQAIIFWLDRYGFLILLALLFFGRVAFLGPIFDFARGVINDIAGLV